MAVDAVLFNEKDNVATAAQVLRVGPIAVIRWERNLSKHRCIV